MKRSIEPDEPRSGDRTRESQCRVVLLGASNLTRGIGPVLDLAHCAWGRPLEVLLAMGHGRSYGRGSCIFGRQLPGIVECGLWSQLDARPELPTAALVTDVGNDILYEEPVEQIVAWVEQCLDRLAAAGAQTTVTLLPVDNLPSLSRWRFTLMRTILVPRCGLSQQEIGRRAHQLNDRLRRLAAERGMDVVRPRAEWYGFDPIHIRLRHRRGAWSETVAAWSASFDSARHVSPLRALHVRCAVPERRRLWGFDQQRSQPAARFADGTTVALY